MHGASPQDQDHNADDLRLVRAIQAGDAAAWSVLLGRYQDRLFGVCLRMIGDREAAADLTQDAMVRIIQGLSSYDGRARLSTWLIRVTMNVCLSHLRGQRLRKHASLDASSAPTAAGNAARNRDGPSAGSLGRGGLGGGSGGGGMGELSPDQRVQIQEDHARVAAALGEVSPEQRSILVLRDVQGLDYDQIAEALEVAVGTVKSRLFRARLALREALEGKANASDIEP